MNEYECTSRAQKSATCGEWGITRLFRSYPHIHLWPLSSFAQMDPEAMKAEAARKVGVRAYNRELNTHYLNRALVFVTRSIRLFSSVLPHFRRPGGWPSGRCTFRIMDARGDQGAEYAALIVAVGFP